MTTSSINTLILKKTMTEVQKRDAFLGVVNKTTQKIQQFASQHKLSVALTEFAAGAALISAGIASGGFLDAGSMIPELIGSLGGGALLGSAASLLGGIGIAAAGGAFGIPVLAVASVGVLAGGLLGAWGGHFMESIISPQISMLQTFAGASLIAAGIYLLFDGIKRIFQSDQVSVLTNKVKKSLSLTTVSIHHI